jgi:GMP synthase (glutamine-hydrolysing)
MHIGILQCGHLPDEMQPRWGDYPDLYDALLAPHGLTTSAWAVVDGAFPESPRAAEGWLVTGSRHGAYEDHPWIPPLEAFIRDCVASNVPIVGVCFGHQSIAQALGGVVEKFPGGWAVGPQDYVFDSGLRVVNAWHQDQVITPPEGAQTVATNPHCAHAALLYPGKALTVQAHPEFSDAFTAELMAARGPGVVPDALMDAARARFGRPLDSDAVAADFARFFHERRIA